MTRTESDVATTIATVADVVVDTDAFVAVVKRRARRRRRAHLAIAGAGTAAVAIAVAVPVSLIAASPTATGPTAGISPSAPRVFTGDCTAEMIAPPSDVEPGHPIWLYDMDPTGRYTVGSYGPPMKADGSVTNTGGVPVRWDLGAGRVLPVGGDNVYHEVANAINRRGTAVGSLRSVINNRTLFFAWVSPDGTNRRILPTPAGWDEAYAVGINDRGDVVGAATTTSQSHAVPVVWSPAADGRWVSRVIEVPAGLRGYGLAITDDGLVVGTLGGEPYVWDPDGTGRALPLPEGITRGSVEQVRGDWAVGFSPGYGTEFTHVVLWNIRTGEMSVIDEAAARGMTVAVNARGDVVWLATRSRPLLRTFDGQEYELPEPPAVPEHGFIGLEPVAMTDDATLIAAFEGVLWRC